MPPQNPWPGVLWRSLWLTAAAALLGYLFGNVLLGLLLLALAALAWQYLHLIKLEQWLRLSRLYPPESSGVWGSVYDDLYRHAKRQRQRRYRLAQLLRSFRESVDAMPDAAVVLREDDDIEWWNRAANRLLGLRSPQDVGQRIDNLLRHPHFRAFLDGEKEQESLTIPSPLDDEILLEVRIIPYGNARRLLLARDITRLRRLEVMRRDFVANITHELRTPLTVVRGMAETLQDIAAHESEDLARPLALIDQQTRRMESLVEDLLTLSRLETGEQEPNLQPVDVAKLLESVLTEARALSDGRHQFELEAQEGLIIEGDKAELRSAISNLASNAVRYSPDGGRISIRWQRHGNEARLSVADTGIGIAPQHIPRLTERFYRVDRGRSARTGGTGLGLAIVKRILHRHGAHLEIESRQGEGSVFICRFPIPGSKERGEALRRPS